MVNRYFIPKSFPFLAPGAAVTTSRNDTDYVVTEYRVAWLRGLNIKQRVEELIRIAHPDFRNELREAAEKIYDLVNRIKLTL